MILQNALIKSYRQNVTASVDKIMYGNDDQCNELEMWYERHGDEGIENLTVATKHKLTSTNYPLIDVSALQIVHNGSCVNVHDKIESITFSEYVTFAKHLSLKWVMSTFALNVVKAMSLLHKEWYSPYHCLSFLSHSNFIMIMHQAY